MTGTQTSQYVIILPISKGFAAVGWGLRGIDPQTRLLTSNMSIGRNALAKPSKDMVSYEHVHVMLTAGSSFSEVRPPIGQCIH